jgi:hypothetical protein
MEQVFLKALLTSNVLLYALYKGKNKLLLEPQLREIQILTLL